MTQTKQNKTKNALSFGSEERHKSFYKNKNFCDESKSNPFSVEQTRQSIILFWVWFNPI